MTQQDPVVVVGAGLAGLAAALHLRGQGRRVLVVEREDEPGGRCAVTRQDGFTFDTGATVMTMPDLVDDALKAVGARVRDVLPMRQLDPAYRAHFADGSVMHVRAGHDAMRAEIARECGSTDAAAFDEFVTWLRRLYLTEMPNFIDRNFDSPLDLVARPAAAARLLALGGFTRLGAQIGRRFQDDRLHRLFSFQAMYAGMSPDQALAIYAVITYMDSIEGVFFPEGGMRAVPAAMAQVAERAGGEFAYGRTATRILTDEGGAVTGVELDGGERVRTGAVVCTLDLPVAYEKLLPDLSLPRALRRPRYSPSAIVWHVGVEGVPQDAAHHNIHFGHAWSGAFDDLLERGTRMSDPSRLVTVPSLDDPNAAPEGHSVLYVLEPVPNLQVGRIDWAAHRDEARDSLHRFVEQAGYPARVVSEEFVTPLDWQARGMAAGTPFALAHTFAQTGPFRPSNVERRRPGVFFAGSSTTPGVGVPMVLVSGKLAAQRVAEYLP